MAPCITRKNVVALAAAAMTSGQALAFYTAPLLPATRVCSTQIMRPSPAVGNAPQGSAARRSSGLRMQTNEEINPADVATLVEQGMLETDAIKVLAEGKTVQEALDLLDVAFARRAAVGDVQNFFKSNVFAEGEYSEEGWVDETEQSRSVPGIGGLFGGIFAGDNVPVTPDGKTRAQLDKEMDKIEFVDGTTGSLTEASRLGTAVPFGGLNPNQIESYKNSDYRKLGDGPAPLPDRYIQYVAKNSAKPLPPGWYIAQDEASGREYYYTAEGDVTWDRPE